MGLKIRMPDFRFRFAGEKIGGEICAVLPCFFVCSALLKVNFFDFEQNLCSH